MFLFINIFLVRLNINRFLHGGVEALSEGVFKIRVFLDNPKSYFEKKSIPELTTGSDESSKNEKDDLKYITQNTKVSINSDDNVNQPIDEKDNSQNINDIEKNQEKLEYSQNEHEIENEQIPIIENDQQTIKNENSKLDIDNNEEQAKNSNNVEIPITIQDNQNQDNFENKKNTVNNINNHIPDVIKNGQNQEINNDQSSSEIKKGIKDDQDKEEIKNEQNQEAKVVGQNQEIIRNNNNDKQETTNQETETIANGQNPNKIEDISVKNYLQNNQGVSSKQLNQVNANDQTIVKTKQAINQEQSKDEDYILRHFNYIDSIIYEIRSNKEVNPPYLIGSMRKVFISMKRTSAGKTGDYWEIAGKEANFTIHFKKSVIKGIELARTNRLCEIKSFQVLDADSDFEILAKTELKYPVQQFVFPTLVSSDTIMLRALENQGDKDLICLRNYSIIAA